MLEGFILGILFVPMLVLGIVMLRRRIRFWRKRKVIVARVRLINAKLRRSITLNDAEQNLVVRWSGQGYVKLDLRYYLRTMRAGRKKLRFLVGFNTIESIENDFQRFLVGYAEYQRRTSLRRFAAN